MINVLINNHNNTSLIICIFVFPAGFDFAFKRDFTHAAAPLSQKKKYFVNKFIQFMVKCISL